MIPKKKWKRSSTSRERQRLYAAKKAAKLKGQEAFEYIWDYKQERFDVFVISDNGTKIRCHYPIARLFVNSTKRLIGWTKETLEKHLTARVDELNGAYADHWHLEIKPKKLRRKPIGA
jgi:hypothetical protein